MEYSCIDIYNCVMATISTVGMLTMTYYVYKLTSKSDKKEHYFTHMVELYNKIEDDWYTLSSLENGNNNAYNFQKKQCARRIKVNSTILIYYLLRIPGYYKGRLDFMGILYDISKNPYDFDNSSLSEMFQEFCWELRETSKNSYGFEFKYDGKPIEK